MKQLRALSRTTENTVKQNGKMRDKELLQKTSGKNEWTVHPLKETLTSNILHLLLDLNDFL